MKILSFDSGTLIFSGADYCTLPAAAARFLKHDSRINTLRGRACDYASIVLGLRSAGYDFLDKARDFSPLEELTLKQAL